MGFGQPIFGQGLWRHRSRKAAPQQLGMHQVGTGRHFKAGHQPAPEEFRLAGMLGMHRIEEGEHYRTTFSVSDMSNI
jgi:hypothetical protein